MKEIEPTPESMQRYEETKAKGADGLVVEMDNNWSDPERAYQAQLLRVQGYSWAETARLCGYPNANHAKVTVRLFQQREALHRDDDFRQQILDLELERTEELIKAYWPTAIQGEVKHAEFVLKTINQQSNMLKLDELHTKATQSSKTIVIAGNAEQYSAALQAIVEGTDAD